MKNIGDNIRYYRNLKGWSQEEMADKINVSLPTYSRIERNINGVPFKRIVQLAKVLGISPSELVTVGKTKNDFANEIDRLKNIISEKDQEIMKLQQKVIELMEKKK
ncbi:MAG: helix-turn-helix transcriptional regulator [Bacteroidetes bacterium]|nr:helix-turn-helix transcriptional regulator [Bacteroidota bacterium]